MGATVTDSPRAPEGPHRLAGELNTVIQGYQRVLRLNTVIQADQWVPRLNTVIQVEQRVLRLNTVIQVEQRVLRLNSHPGQPEGAQT